MIEISLVSCHLVHQEPSLFSYFDSVDICKVQTGRDLYEVRTQGVFPDSAKLPPTTFFLEVNTPTEIDLSIFQQGSR